MYFDVVLFVNSVLVISLMAPLEDKNSGYIQVFPNQCPIFAYIPHPDLPFFSKIFLKHLFLFNFKLMRAGSVVGTVNGVGW